MCCATDLNSVTALLASGVALARGGGDDGRSSNDGSDEFECEHY